MVDRRGFLTVTAGAVVAATTPQRPAAERRIAAPLVPPDGPIRVAHLVSERTTAFDFVGPWDVFASTMLDGMHHPFEQFVVGPTREPLRAIGGLRIVPDHGLDDAPHAHIVVVPAMNAGARTHAWLRERLGTADLVMSVCTGAFVLASAGLLDGKDATTHHDHVDVLQRDHPRVRVKRGVRWVESAPKLATSAGVASGVDLAIRVVERYFGTAKAREVAAYIALESERWRA